MANLSELIKSISRKHGSVIDLNKNPEILMDIITDLRINAPQEHIDTTAQSATPFGVPWLDSWAANWMLHQQQAKSRGSSEIEFNTVVKQLTELKFRERLSEIKKFILDQSGFLNETPDGGPPEPGTPPAGPTSIFAEPPDGGTPEPGVPPSPEPPDGGTPEPGVPPGPTPGPDDNILINNPWILYWFVSINAPLILDMIDAHFTRRMNDLKQQVIK